jgi:hypothetical protein
MLIRDLPTEQREQFRAWVERAGQPWEVIQGLTMYEAHDWMQTCVEDSSARLERMLHRLAVQEELFALADPVNERYPDLPMEKVEYFLHGKQRARFQELMRELAEISKVQLITRDRQPWHGAAEEAICCGLEQGGGCTVEDVVDAVLARDPAYPGEQVRRYVEYILETAAGMR